MSGTNSIATYRADCGHEMVDRRPGRKSERIGCVVMGWQGNEQCADPDWRVDQPPPERCQTCSSLQREMLIFLNDDGKGVNAWSCYSYKLVRQQSEATKQDH